MAQSPRQPGPVWCWRIGRTCFRHGERRALTCPGLFLIAHFHSYTRREERRHGKQEVRAPLSGPLGSRLCLNLSFPWSPWTPRCFRRLRCELFRAQTWSIFHQPDLIFHGQILPTRVQFQAYSPSAALGWSIRKRKRALPVSSAGYPCGPSKWPLAGHAAETGRWAASVGTEGLGSYSRKGRPVRGLCRGVPTWVFSPQPPRRCGLNRGLRDGSRGGEEDRVAPAGYYHRSGCEGEHKDAACGDRSEQDNAEYRGTNSTFMKTRQGDAMTQFSADTGRGSWCAGPPSPLLPAVRRWRRHFVRPRRVVP